MSHKPPVSSELSRELSLFHITMMGLGMMIGAGVFLGVGVSVAKAGPGGVVLTFALNGLIALFTAMSYAELSSAIPRAGGAYNFARVGFGRRTSFVAGWMEWFASSVAGSLYAVTFGIYIVRYLRVAGVLGWIGLDDGSDYFIEKAMAVLVALFFLYINYRGAAETGKLGAVVTLAQTLFLVFIGLVGVVTAIRQPERLANFDPFLPEGWGALLITMGLTYVAFEGYEVIAQTGDEAIDPKRNLPKAMIYSVLIVTLTYILTAFATVVAVKAGAPDVGDVPVWEWIGSHGAKGFGEAIGRIMPGANLLLTLAVICAATSALNATIYSATRASYALGRDNMLPPFFAAISTRRKTPYVALAFTGVILLVVATVLPTEHVGASASIMFLLLFFLVNICVIVIRRNMGDELSYGYVMPLFPLFPVAAIICQGVLAYHLHHTSMTAWIVAIAWISTGVLVFIFYGRRHAVATEDEIIVIEESQQTLVTDTPETEKTTGPARIRTAPGKQAKHRVMVALANPNNALELIRNTYKICGAKNASVELLHMVPVPEQTPLSDAEQYMLEGKESMLEAMLYLAPQFPLSSTMRYCRNVARGIVSAIREKHIDTLIMGWHGRQSGLRTFNLGSTVDPIVERSPSNVVILKDCGGNVEFRNVLVPLAGGHNAAYALEVASILCEDDGQVTAITIQNAQNRNQGFNIDQFVRQHARQIHLPEQQVRTRTLQTEDNVAEVILAQAGQGDYDLIVMGCTREPLLRQVTRNIIPDAVADRCPLPLVMVKATGGLRSWLHRWI